MLLLASARGNIMGPMGILFYGSGWLPNPSRYIRMGRLTKLEFALRGSSLIENHIQPPASDVTSLILRCSMPIKSRFADVGYEVPQQRSDKRPEADWDIDIDMSIHHVKKYQV